MPNLTKSVAMTDGGGGIKRKKAGTTNQTAQSQTGNTANTGTGRTVKRSSEGQERSHISQSPASLIGENPISQLSKQRQWQEMKRAVDHATLADTPAAFANRNVKNLIPSTAVQETQDILNQYRQEAAKQQEARNSRAAALSEDAFHRNQAFSLQYGDSYENYLNDQKDMSTTGIQAQLDSVNQQIDTLMAQEQIWRDAEYSKIGGIQYLYEAYLDAAYLGIEMPTESVQDQINQLTAERGNLNALLEQTKAKEWENKQRSEILASGGDALLAEILKYSDEYGKNAQSPELRSFVKTLRDMYSEDQVASWFQYADRVNSAEDYQRRIEGAAAFAQEHPVVGSIGSVPLNLLSGIGAVNVLAQNIGNALTGSDTPVNYKTSAMQFGGMSGAIRGQVASDIEAGTEGWAGSDTVFGNLYSDVYQLGMSMADSAAVAAMSYAGVPWATSLLGGSAATRTMTDAKARGASDAQALTLGLISGTAEALFERVSIEHLFDLDSPRTVKSFFSNVLSQAVPEASEEVNTTLANTAADLFIMGDKSQYLTEKRQYMAQGMTATQAEKQAGMNWFRGLMADALGGFVSGGLFATGANAVNGFQSRRSGSSTAYRGNSQPVSAVQDIPRHTNPAEIETGANTMLTNADLQEYLLVGAREHVRNTKKEQLQNGGSPILTNTSAIRDFIKTAIDRKIPETIKAYGKVGKNMASDVASVSEGKTNINGYYLELDSNRLAHLSDHIKDDGDVRNIPLTEEQVLNIPEYINHYDDILNVTTKKDGSTRIILGKKINGHAVIVELVSKGRQSIQPVTAWQNATDQYVQKYAKKGAYTTSQTAIKAADSGYTHAPISTITQPSQKVNRSHIYQARYSAAGGKEASLPAVQELSSETLREWLQAAGHTGDSLSAIQNLYAQNGMAPKKASQTVLQNLLNRYAGAFQNGTDGVTAQAIAEAAEKDRLERTVAGENARYNGTAEALVEAALQLPQDTEARNLADQATIARQAEILGKLEELEAAKKQARGIQTSAQLLEFTRTIGRLEQELEALEQGRLSDRLDSETLGRLSEAVQNGQAQQATGQTPAYPTAQDTGKLTEGGKNGNVDAENRNDSGRFKEILSSGHVDKAILAQEPAAFKNVSINQMDEFLQSIGYKTMVAAASRSESGAKKIAIKNANHTMNIKQIQFSPGGGMHGPNPYLKFSTNGPGVLKIVFGDPKTYIFNGEDTGKIIFEEDHYD